MAIVVLHMKQKMLQKPMKEKIQIDTGFDVISIDDLNLVVDVCCGKKANVLLIEVSTKGPGDVDEVEKYCHKLSTLCPNCKIVFLCDPNDGNLGDRVVELKKSNIIDSFIYSNTNFDFLTATIKSLV